MCGLFANNKERHDRIMFFSPLSVVAAYYHYLFTLIYRYNRFANSYCFNRMKNIVSDKFTMIYFELDFPCISNTNYNIEKKKRDHIIPYFLNLLTFMLSIHSPKKFGSFPLIQSLSFPSLHLDYADDWGCNDIFDFAGALFVWTMASV